MRSSAEEFLQRGESLNTWVLHLETYYSDIPTTWTEDGQSYIAAGPEVGNDILRFERMAEQFTEQLADAADRELYDALWILPDDIDEIDRFCKIYGYPSEENDVHHYIRLLQQEPGTRLFVCHCRWVPVFPEDG